ncbi:sensor histidine kinase [Luteitalea pratensis]|nr:HAMP domain-containing sensor histidine kinase [Luteitalea pratensis]
MLTAEFESFIADRIAEQHRALAARWFDRLLLLLPVGAREIFPTNSLLDHIPFVIAEIGECVRRPDEVAVAANTSLTDKARELGNLRHGQRASLHQVLREYQILGDVLVAFVLDELAGVAAAPDARAAVLVVARLQQAVNALCQTTVETFVALYTETITDQARRLEEFTRLAAHEWRQPLSTLQFGVTLLQRPDLDGARTTRLWEAMERNVAQLVEVTRKLEAVARLGGGQDTPVLQAVALTTVAQEASRQLHDMAEARGVAITIADDLPELLVDVGRLELVLVNLLSNGIKYADPSRPTRHVMVTGRTSSDGEWCEVDVSDNGVGIPAHALNGVFRRFSRAHADREDLAHVAGLGLGLAIVDDAMRALDGQVWVASVEGEGTTFTLRLPMRAAGTGGSS